MEHFERAKVRTGLVSREEETHDGIVASLHGVTKVFMRFAANVTGRLSMQLCISKAYCISNRDVAFVEKKKDIFHSSYIEKTFFYFEHSSSFQRRTHGFHNDQEKS